MILFVTGLMLVLFSVDMLLKQHAEEALDTEEEKELISGKVVLRKVYNKGFMLHILDCHPAAVKSVSAVVGAGMLLYDGILFLKKGRWIKKTGMAIFTAGAASNAADRIVRGKVIDYIGFRSRSQFLSRLTINLADLYIAAGAVLAAAGGIIRIGKKTRDKSGKRT